MRCPNCKNKLLQRQNGSTRVRTQGPMLIKSDGCYCQYFWCKSDVIIPLQVREGVDIPEEPRLYIGDPERLDVSRKPR